jgi:hypothetical protein
VLVTGLGGPTLLALDATNLFFADSGKGMIGRVAKTGGATQMLVSGEANVQGLAVDDTHVYWSSFVGNAIKRILKGGGAIEVVSAASDPRTLAVDSADVFWANQGTGKVLKAPKQGGGPITELNDSTLAVIDDVKLDGDYVYWGSGAPYTNLLRARKDSSGSPEDVIGWGGSVIAFDQDYVYAGGTDGAGVYRRRKDLSEPTYTATYGDGGNSAPTALAVAGIFTYSYAYDGSGRALKCGGQVPIILGQWGPSTPMWLGTPIVVDEAYVYTVFGPWSVDDGRIERRPL